MKLKTFLATYALFLVIFFGSFGAVSAYMTNSQMRMLRDKSIGEFGTIAASFAKDIAVLSGRDQEQTAFDESVHALAEGYSNYYRKNNITILLEDMGEESASEQTASLEYIDQGQQTFLKISGFLAGSFQRYRLDYSSDVTGNIEDLRNMQRVLLLLAVGCSAFAAAALYAILSGIFNPFVMVAQVSRKIADGLYSERIQVKGAGELASMAGDFNRMAAEIERQIHLLEEEAAAKQQFVDNFAHEIRTPLTSIYGYAEYIQNAPLDKEEVIESAQAILKEAGYMRKIADSLLELATLRKYTAEKREINLPRLFAEISQSLRGLMPERKAEISCVSSADVLYGQEDLIRSLLMNLGFNALKACSDEGGVIKIESRHEANRVVLSVTDNGCGIPAESADKVIEAFYRVDRARSRETGGAGLGLALCRQIAEAHGAELLIESELNKGTKVEVIFTTP